MKYLIIALLVIGSLVGGAGSTYYYVNNAIANEFYDMTGVAFSDFKETYGRCVVENKEDCAIYGGFAPLSKFHGRSL